MEIITVTGDVDKAMTNAKKQGIKKLANVDTEKYNSVA